jgi:hypothetical protein
MNYQTKLRLLGLPMVHVSTGPRQSGGGPAKGWIAIGDRAFGVLFAAGGFALGGIALGGVSIGIFSLGGLALGVFGIGGLAVGVWAVGGLALGLLAAQGGLALAVYFAEGGGAIAKHANDAVSAYFFRHGFVTPFASLTSWILRYILQPLLLFALIAWVIVMRRRKNA